jgi:hypothetical protein
MLIEFSTYGITFPNSATGASLRTESRVNETRRPMFRAN